MVIKTKTKAVTTDRLFYALKEGYKIPPAVIKAAEEQVKKAMIGMADCMERDYYSAIMIMIREYKVRNKSVILKSIDDYEKLIDLYEKQRMQNMVDRCKEKLAECQKKARNFDIVIDLEGK